MTKEEKHLWYDFLKHLPVTVHRQRVIGKYIVDFFIASKKTVVEIDGAQHFEGKHVEDDIARDSYMKELGINVLRYTNRDINTNFEGVCCDILNKICLSYGEYNTMTNIQKFFLRIGLPADMKIEKNFEFLKKIQLACVKTIAYENLDILDGKPLSLDADDLFEKIVEQGRGGYCFEVNGLLSHILKEMGFHVDDYFARYLRGETETPMRRHRILAVQCDDGRFFCDIGIGQPAPRYPVKMEEGTPQPQFDEVYKFEKDAEFGWILYDLHEGQRRKFISFTEEIQYEVDFVQPSFFCEAHPSSPFNKVPMIAIKTEKGRKTLDNRTFKVFEDGKLSHIEENISDERFYNVLNEEFFINYKK